MHFRLGRFVNFVNRTCHIFVQWDWELASLQRHQTTCQQVSQWNALHPRIKGLSMQETVKHVCLRCRRARRLFESFDSRTKEEVIQPARFAWCSWRNASVICIGFAMLPMLPVHVRFIYIRSRIIKKLGCEEYILSNVSNADTHSFVGTFSFAVLQVRITTMRQGRSFDFLRYGTWATR